MIISDLDGTLFKGRAEELSRDFITKIKKLTDCGVIFSISSGRTYADLKGLVNSLQNRTVFICNDGAQIMYKNCLIYKLPIAKERFFAATKMAVENGLEVFACLREKNIYIGKELLETPSLLSEEVYKIVILKGEKSEPIYTKIKNEAEKTGLRVCFEDEKYLELCRKDADKGAALEYIKNRFGITDGIAAFGDGENDIPMFEKANAVYIVSGKNKLCYPGAIHIDNMQDFVIENL